MNWYKRFIYAGIQPESKADFIKLLEGLGCKFLRQGKGDHMIYWNPATRGQTGIPDGPGNREINPKTMEKMLKELGISYSGEFRPFRHMSKKQKRQHTEQLQQPVEPAVEMDVPDYQKQRWWIEQQKFNPGGAV